MKIATTALVWRIVQLNIALGVVALLYSLQIMGYLIACGLSLVVKIINSAYFLKSILGIFRSWLFLLRIQYHWFWTSTWQRPLMREFLWNLWVSAIFYHWTIVSTGTYWVIAVSQLIWILHHHFLLILILSLILQLNVGSACVLIYIFQLRRTRLLQRPRYHILHKLHLRYSSWTAKRELLWSVWLLTLKRQLAIIGLPEQMIAPILIEHHRLRILIINLRLLPPLIPLRCALHILTRTFHIIRWVQMVDTSLHSCFARLSRFTSFVWWFFQVAVVTIFI